MTAAYQIQYIKHRQVDKTKWDSCIGNVSNSLLYNHSSYLDCMAAGWDALVLNDYEAVMPLTWRRKWGITYLYQPYFMAQLGITGNNITPALVDAFLYAIPSHIRYIDIDIAETNDTIDFVSFCNKRVNMLLDIDKDYNIISDQYHRLATRMIRKAKEAAITVETSDAIADSIAFYQQQYSGQLPVPPADYQNITNLFNIAAKKGQLVSLVAKKNNQLMGVYLLLQDNHFVYSVLGGSSPEGKEQGVFYLLTDAAIQLTANSGRGFRFEGSDKPGIAGFNQQFGAAPFTYHHLRINRLPYLLRFLKNS